MPGVSTLVMVGGTLLANQQASKAQKFAQKQATLDRIERDKAKADFDKRIEKYEKSEFVPLDLEALKTENIFEEADLTKDVLPAADYAREQFQQQQANIMQGLKGVAGSSGIAGLAQSLSMQAADQARQTGITIGQQLAQGRRLALQERAQKQAQERQIILSNMQGKNQFELDKMTTLMGVSGQKVYAATQGLQQSQANIAQIQAGQTAMWGNIAGSIGGGGYDLGNLNWGGYGSPNSTSTINTSEIMDTIPSIPGLV